MGKLYFLHVELNNETAVFVNVLKFCELFGCLCCAVYLLIFLVSLMLQRLLLCVVTVVVVVVVVVEVQMWQKMLTHFNCRNI